MINKKFRILSVEDHKPDFDLLKKTLSNIKNINIEIINIIDGENALDYIFKRNGYKNVLTPHLIILDINLPKISGFEILQEIKSHSEYKFIPVVMFTTSSDNENIKKSYEKYVNSYIIKNYDIESLLEKIRVMGEYWLKTSELPENNDIYIIEKDW